MVASESPVILEPTSVLILVLFIVANQVVSGEWLQTTQHSHLVATDLPLVSNDEENLTATRCVTQKPGLH